MVKIGIPGANGRMGKILIQSVIESTDSQLSGATVRHGNPLLGADTGEFVGHHHNGIAVTDDIEALFEQSDVIVDFTLPAVTEFHLKLADKHHTAVVLGTTGHNDQQKHLIRHAAERTPVVWAPNMSVGVNLSLALAKKMAEVYGDSADVEIIETHHRHKVDAPSGTALALGETIANTLGRDLKQCAVYGREGFTGERDNHTIGFSTIRGGDVVGDHTVLFALEGERMELTHKASSRMTFGNGAVRAAHWLSKKPAGLYSMLDVLGL